MRDDIRQRIGAHESTNHIAATYGVGRDTILSIAAGVPTSDARYDEMRAFTWLSPATPRHTGTLEWRREQVFRAADRATRQHVRKLLEDPGATLESVARDCGVSPEALALIVDGVADARTQCNAVRRYLAVPQGERPWVHRVESSPARKGLRLVGGAA